MQLLINSNVIPIEAGTNLPLVLRSPLFVNADGKIPGSYIFNFSIPAGETIRHIFSQAHRVQHGGRATAELPYVITSGSLRYSGTCTVTEAKRDSYEISCKVSNGDLTGKLKSKTLKDLAWGGDKSIADIYSAAQISTITYDYTYSGHFEFPVVSLFNIICDITGSMSSLGRVFTAPQTLTIKQKIYLSARFRTGYLQLTLKKNGVLYFDSTISAGTAPFIDYSSDLVLTAGDIITLDLIVKSEGDPSSGETIGLTLERCSIEYSTVNIFTTVVDLDQYESDYAIFPIQNSKFLDNFPDDAFQIDNTSIKTLYSTYYTVLNYWKDGEFPFMLSAMSEGENIFAANLFTPFIYMRSILAKIAGEAGYYIVNNPFDDDDFKGMVLFNAYSENMYVGDTASIVPVKPTFNLADHAPPIDQADFVRWVSFLTGYMPVVNNNTFEITFVNLKNKHLVTPTNTITPFPGKLLADPLVKVAPEYKGIKFQLTKATSDSYLNTIKDLHDKLDYKGEVIGINYLPTTGNKVNDMYLVTALNEYYVYQYNPETYTLTWWFYSKKFPITYTEGTEPFLELTTDLCPVLTSRIEDETLGASAGRIWTIPKSEQPGILEGFPDSLGSEYGTQVLFYRGLVNDSLGDAYPLGSSRLFDFTGTVTEAPDISADSLFTYRYKAFLQWLAYETKPATFKAILSAGELKQIRFDQIYSGYGFNFLVREIRVNMGIDGLSLAEIDIYTC